MSHGHDIHIHQENYKFTGKAKTLSLSLLVIGIVVTVIGIFTIPSNTRPTVTNHSSHSSLLNENHLAYYNVGYINYENGMMDEALRNWNTCTQMNPGFANAFYMKGF